MCGILMLSVMLVAAMDTEAASTRQTREAEQSDGKETLDKDLSLLYGLLLRGLQAEKRDQCGVTSQVSADDQRLIVDMHNQEREHATSGAAGMLKMEWDDALARRAQELADKCVFEHALTEMCDGTSIGQNIAMGTGELGLVTFMVNGWINEKADYFIDVNVCASDKVCGHYTAMVWDNTNKVGCGMTTCSALFVFGKVVSNAQFLVCDYRPSGNWNGKAPFNKGAKCSGCDKVLGENAKATCDANGFCAPCTGGEPGCECANKRTCQNGGSFIQSDCKCKCTGAWAGDNCQVDTNSITDKSEFCDQWLDNCDLPLYKDFMTENCQKTCKLY